MKKIIITLIIVLAVLAVGVYGLIIWAQKANAPQAGDGIRFGFIREVKTEGGSAIVFDDANWFVGEAAKQAALASGACTTKDLSDCAPNDFYISNPSDETTDITFGEAPTIAMMTLKMEEEGVKENDISVEEFAQLVNGSTKHWSEVPYQIWVEKGKVTIIEEVYTP